MENKEITMLSKEEIGYHIISIAKDLIKFKQSNSNDKLAPTFLGYLYGLMVALGKEEEFEKAENWLAYTNSVIEEIFKADIENAKNHNINNNIEKLNN